MKEGGRWPLFFCLCVCQYAQVFFKNLVKMTIDLWAGKWYIIITRNKEQAKGREEIDMFYTLNNGETIEIDIFEDENYEKYISFKLFGGSTVINYRCKERNNLNEILSEIEADYEQLKEEDYEFTYRAYCD